MKLNKKTKKKKNKKNKIVSFSRAFKSTNPTYYDGMKYVKVYFEDFEIYVKGLKEKAYTPHAHHIRMARIYTKLQPDKLLYIQLHFRQLAMNWGFDLSTQEFRR
tara:strand:+ start:154 stop:465 length:312 start_codon:yes stop_codon:yes gene_type:complete